MDNKTGSIINGNISMFPLISFYTIVDIDVGLVQLIKNEYLNTDVFKLDFFQKPLLEIIKELYFRKEQNPLYLFAKNKSNKKLDLYYSDFIKEKMDDILNLSVTTAIEELLFLFKKSSNICPTILCYSQEQMDLLDKEKRYSGYKKVLLSDLNEITKYDYTQYYFNLIEEAEPFVKAENKTFYFSSCGRNLSMKNDDVIDSDIITSLIDKKMRNQISLFDLYNLNLL